MTQKKNITFDDIAQYTHFSKTTISRYFNNPDSLTLENQQIISDALVKLNYKENKVARILANGKTEFVGILIPNLYLHYYSEMLNQILATYETYGYKFLVFIGHENAETERQYIQELLAYKIEGLIVLSHTLSSRELADLHNQGKDVIVVSSGAIAVGRSAMGIHRRPDELAEKQACAAVGQARLMMIQCGISY